MRRKDGAKGRIALLFMVFAQAKNYMPLTKGNDTRLVEQRAFGILFDKL